MRMVAHEDPFPLTVHSCPSRYGNISVQSQHSTVSGVAHSKTYPLLFNTREKAVGHPGGGTVVLEILKQNKNLSKINKNILTFNLFHVILWKRKIEPHKTD